MKVVVTGAGGMLGTQLVSSLANSEMDVVALSHSDFDITDKREMSRILSEKPDFLVNCAAYTNVDLAETEKEKCLLINTQGVRNLADACSICGAVLIQISTDYVFDGKKEGYNENDKKNPVNHYGLSKSLAEDYIISKLEEYYIVRTSWLFGKNGKNFVDTISKLSDEKKEIIVVSDQLGRPTYTADLANALVSLMNQKPEFGIYHLTNSGSCSWFDFAQEIVKIRGAKCDVKPCTTEQYPRPAKRPKFSVLNNNKFVQLPDWKIALRKYMEVI